MLYACLPVCMPVCVPACLSVWLASKQRDKRTLQSACLDICMSICLPNIFWLFCLSVYPPFCLLSLPDCLSICVFRYPLCICFFFLPLFFVMSFLCFLQLVDSPTVWFFLCLIWLCGKREFLQTCRFAPGDIMILCQKLAGCWHYVGTTCG